MMRPATCLLLLALGSVLPAFTGVSAAADTPALTRFRHNHAFRVHLHQGEEATIGVEAISASVGYPDGTAFQCFGPDGTLVESGDVAVGKTTQFTLRGKEDGTYLLLVDPGQNAASVAPSVAHWLVDLTDKRTLEVISVCRPLYFLVRPKVSSFKIEFNGEPGDVQVFQPDGVAALKEQIPAYTRRQFAVNVPAGMDGKPWRLEMRLNEDMAVTLDEAAIEPLVAESAAVIEGLNQFEAGGGLLTFDGMQTPRAGMQPKGALAEAQSLSSGALKLGFAATGEIVHVQAGGGDVTATGPAGMGGIFVRDVARGGAVYAVTGTLTQAGGGGLLLSGTVKDLDLTVTGEFHDTGQALTGNVRVKDNSGQDRAVTVFFALPVRKEDMSWWLDLDQSVPADSPRELGVFGSSPAGANGKHSLLPLACLSGPTGGVAIAIPLDQPRLCRLAYNPHSQHLFAAFDVALTPAAAKNPSQADVEVALFASDPKWGLRSAVEQYYRVYPRCFERRIKRDGGWACWGTLERLTSLKELGFLYHWGPGGPTAVAFDNHNGIYSYLYNDSCRFFADLGEFKEKPNAQQATEVFKTLLTAENPREFVLSRPKEATGRQRFVGLERELGPAADDYFRRLYEAIRRSAATGADGTYLVNYVINREDWGPKGVNWWTGRLFCNVDPDLDQGYGQFLLRDVLQRTFTLYEQQGGRLDGVGLDNYFVNATMLDFERSHLAAADHPPTFSRADHRPVLVGDFIVFEWVAELAKWLRTRDGAVIANTGRMTFPFAASLLDINGYEWGIEREAWLARLLAFKKPVVTLPVQPAHYEEAFLRAHVRFGIFPGGYGDKRFETDQALGDLYRRYVPVIRRLAEAGWEPVPHAATGLPGVPVERFGSGKTAGFTVTNTGNEPVTATLTIDAATLGLGDAMRLADLFSGKDLDVSRSANGWRLQLSLEAKQSAAIGVIMP